MDNVLAISDQTSGSFKSSTQTMVEFGHIWADGCRNISDIMTNASQAYFEHMTTTMRAMGDVKTIKGAMELQMAATRTSIEQTVAHSNKLSAASMELADKGMAPVTAYIGNTMAKFSSMRPTLT